MRFIELFAGFGLVRLALERHGWECVFANDISPKKQLTYTRNFGTSDFLLGDVWQLDIGAMPTADLLTASFPCTDLSLAGNRSGLEGKHSSAFWAVIQILDGLRRAQRAPKIVLIENVVGFITSRGGEDFLAAVRALNEQGYVVDAVVVDAKHFTAQSRPRVFLIAVQNGGCTGVGSMLKPTALQRVIDANKNLGWGFLNLPQPPALNQKLSDIIENLPESSDRWWSGEQTVKLVSQMSKAHRAVLEQMKSSPAYTYGTIYRRTRGASVKAELRTDGLAGCLRTPGGGSSKQIVVRAGSGEVHARWLTPREYGRLQGVPDSFALPDSDHDAYFGFGDAVCVPVIEWLAVYAINPCFGSFNQDSS